jgi:hypothetical protein
LHRIAAPTGLRVVRLIWTRGGGSPDVGRLGVAPYANQAPVERQSGLRVIQAWDSAPGVFYDWSYDTTVFALEGVDPAQLLIAPNHPSAEQDWSFWTLKALGPWPEEACRYADPDYAGTPEVCRSPSPSP